MMQKFEDFEKKFTDFFTKDGLDLILNYLHSLKNQLNNSEITIDQQDLVMNGIYEFISEFSLNYTNSRINFSDTLNLIEEIGSPSEIIQSFDFNKIEGYDFVMCPYCKWKNDLQSVFCEYCGKKVKTKEDTSSGIKNLSRNKINSDFKQKLNQDFIDHPYSRSIIIASILSIIIIYISSLPTSLPILFNSPITFILFSLFIVMLSFFLGFFPSIFLGLIFGFIFDLKYKNKKSLKFRQDKILQHFEENRAGGLFLVFIGFTILSLLFGSASASSIRPLIVLIWMISIFLNVFFGLYYDRSGGKPTDLSLTQLNKLKLTVEKINNLELISINKKVVPIVIILSFLTLLLNFNYISSIAPSNLVSILFVLFLVYGISYLAIINGVLYMQLNSWKNVSRIYSNET